MITTKQLEDFNEWWATGRIPEDFVLKHSRSALKELVGELGSRFVCAIVGLRRVGKTTLMYQMTDHLLKKEDAKRILYFSFDEMATTVEEVLESYREAKEMDFRKERAYIFFDEIQKARNWENQLKKYYDLYPKLKFIISGSESLFIKGKTKETLAGRLFEIFLPPLSFREYLVFTDMPAGAPTREFEKRFRDYVRRGGFPEALGMDEQRIGRYVRTVIVDKVIYRDIRDLGGVKDPAVLARLLEALTASPGSYVEYSSLAQQLGIDQRTVSKFVFLLRESFLVRELANYRKGRIAMLRKAKRAYPADNAFFHAFGISLDEHFFGRAVETTVINALRGECFWKNTYEVDLVKDGIPMEIKYQPRIVPADLKGVRSFMRKFKVREGIVITKEEERELKVDEGRIRLIPAWKFLYQSGD